MTRRMLLALGALSLLSACSVLPARSDPRGSDMRGSYFGSFTSSKAHTLPGDLNVSLHSRHVISGSLSIGGVLRDLSWTGRCSASGSFTATGYAQQGARKLRLRLTGRFQPAGNGELARLTGTYSVTGTGREQGIFSLSGGSTLP